jgi:hypothetical protein
VVVVADFGFLGGELSIMSVPTLREPRDPTLDFIKLSSMESPAKLLDAGLRRTLTEVLLIVEEVVVVDVALPEAGGSFSVSFSSFVSSDDKATDDSFSSPFGNATLR